VSVGTSLLTFAARPSRSNSRTERNPYAKVPTTLDARLYSQLADAIDKFHNSVYGMKHDIAHTNPVEYAHRNFGGCGPLREVLTRLRLAFIKVLDGLAMLGEPMRWPWTRDTTLLQTEHGPHIRLDTAHRNPSTSVTNALLWPIEHWFAQIGAHFLSHAGYSDTARLLIDFTKLAFRDHHDVQQKLYDGRLNHIHSDAEPPPTSGRSFRRPHVSFPTVVFTRRI
jgi:hypothetical protein